MFCLAHFHGAYGYGNLVVSVFPIGVRYITLSSEHIKRISPHLGNPKGRGVEVNPTPDVPPAALAGDNLHGLLIGRGRGRLFGMGKGCGEGEKEGGYEEGSHGSLLLGNTLKSALSCPFRSI